MIHFDISTPTPTPPPLTALSDALDHSSQAVTSIAQLGALGVFVLFLLIIFAGVVVFGMYVYFRRKSGMDVQTIHAQILQTQQNELVEGRKERAALSQRMSDNETTMGERIIETNVGFSEALNGMRDLFKEFKQGNQLAMSNANKQIASIQENLADVIQNGSPPLQEIKSEVVRIFIDPEVSLPVINGKIDSMMKTLEEIKTDLMPCIETKKVVGDNPAIAETVNQLELDMRLVRTALGLGIQEEKHKSRPIPTVAPDEQGSEAA